MKDVETQQISPLSRREKLIMLATGAGTAVAFYALFSLAVEYKISLEGMQGVAADAYRNIFRTFYTPMGSLSTAAAATFLSRMTLDSRKRRQLTHNSQ